MSCDRFFVEYEYLRSSNRRDLWDLTDPSQGNRWRCLGQGSRVVAFPIWLYCDGTSGNTSKNGMSIKAFSSRQQGCQEKKLTRFIFCVRQTCVFPGIFLEFAQVQVHPEIKCAILLLSTNPHSGLLYMFQLHRKQQYPCRGKLLERLRVD